MSNKLKYLCTGCDAKSVAEYVHELLSVPLCGNCNNRYQHADFSYQEQYCAWCGEGDDGRELFCCDTCSYAFCVQCIDRNFKSKQSEFVRACDPWSCYICLPTPELNKIKVNDSIFYNMELAYAAIRPPSKFETLCCDIANFTQAELRFIDVMTSSIFSQRYHFKSVPSDYLHAKDVFSVIYRLSKNIRKYFMNHFLYPSPGLFKTDFGDDNGCKLYNHQLVSLQKMTAIENRDNRFGILRGGILADEPGLGKTVTMLALCLSTAGTMPKAPDCFWDETSLANSWSNHAASGALMKELLPVVNNIMKVVGRAPMLVELQRQVNSVPCPFLTYNCFEQSVKNILNNDPLIDDWMRKICIQTFRQDMIKVKSKLDRKSRKFQRSTTGSRILFERCLRPSSGTLIIVPLVLLEHWYEQIARHIGLNFLYDESNTSDNLPRGVVFIDGLGDIVDVEAPLPKLALNEGLNSSMEHLSNYMFVITTFERCATLNNCRMNLKNVTSSNRDDEGCESVTAEDLDTWGNSPTSLALKAFLGVRWLRLIIDEGHEIASLESNVSINNKQRRSGANTIMMSAAKFIGDIAAERRWVMSGTPTTGTNSIEALWQLQKLLGFLRHSVYGNSEIGASKFFETIVKPISERDQNGWRNLISVLNSIMIRHTKNDLNLEDPVRSLILLDKIPDPNNPNEEKSRHIDRAMAKYIADTIAAARDVWKKNKGEYRRPKAIVFSQHREDLQGVGHFLYTDIRFGDSSLCEHDGTFRSSELSRFRHSKKKFRLCSLCGYENKVTTGQYCDNTLVLVEYLFEDGEHVPAFSSTSEVQSNTEPQTPPPPSEGGHSAYGRGGHYTGRCLCSPTGCSVPCNGFINALGPLHLENSVVNPNFAIVAEDHIAGWTIGRRWFVNEHVVVTRQDPLPENETIPILWRNGRLGGRARIAMWLKCGSRSRLSGWHGGRVLEQSRWQSLEEDASILLLHKDGSHGLDLSFATHLFLLEKIKDPALERQIISRAHRMGAEGAVNVQLLQTRSTPDDEIQSHKSNDPVYWHAPI